MQKIGLFFMLVVLLPLAGCGCLETWEDRLPRPGSGGIDPDQSALDRCLFGTRHLKGRGAPVPIMPTSGEKVSD